MAARRGGGATEQRLGARVATNDGVANTGGYGRGVGGPTKIADNIGAKGRPTDPLDPRIITKFSHRPEDTELELNFDFQPNILDNFDVYTYHWKLFIVDPQSASTGDILTLENQTIIAESGVTDLTIDKVDVKGITTPSVESGTGIATSVKFEILEPSGAGLIDKMFYQAIGLGIGNWSVMPVYLQLQFRGRDPVTGESLTDGATGDIASLKWIWPLKLTSIKANVTTVGTRYDFDAIVYNELAQSNAYFTMMSSVSLRNLESVQDALSELEDKLNADQIHKLIDNYSIPDVYRIVIDPEIAGQVLQTYVKNGNSSRSGSYEKMNLKDATFGPGTSVDKIIDTILSHTIKYQTEMVGSATPGGEGLPASVDESQMKKMWRIITESRPLQFDPRRLDDAREFTIYVIEYDVGILESNVFQESGGDDPIAAEKRRLAKYLSNSILKKKYNYIFTGLNDQVINLDLTVNNAFAVSQARMGGIYYNLAMASAGMAYYSSAKDEAEVTEKLRAYISFHNASTPDKHFIKSSQDQLASLTQAIDAANISVDRKEELRAILEKAKPENRIKFDEKRRSTSFTNADDLGVTRAKATSLAIPQLDQVSNQQLNFISDVNSNLTDPNNDLTLKTYNNYLNSVKGKLRPIAHVERLQDAQIGQGMESSNNSGIQKLSSMFAVALHSSLDASFQQLKLVIKGDPFWLFPQPFSGNNRPIYNSLKDPNDAINWIKNAHMKLDSTHVNIFSTDNFLIIRFRTPRIYNIEEESDGDRNSFNEVMTFSGVYKVVRVSSNFASGKFTQELECILDPFINIVNFTDEIENDNKQLDIATSANELRSDNNIPNTAIKKAKLETNKPAKGVGDRPPRDLGKELVDNQRKARELAREAAEKSKN